MRISFLFLFLVPLTLSGQQMPAFQNLEKDLRVLVDGPGKIQAYHQAITEIQGQDPKLSQELITDLFLLSAKINSSEGLAWANYQQAFYHNMKGEYDSLKVYADRSVNLARKNRLPKAEASAIQLVATYHWQIGSFDESVRNHFTALRIREKIKDSVGIGSSLASLGVVHQSNNRLDKAKTYIGKARVIAKSLQDDKLMLRCLHSLANIYGMEGNYNEALKADHEALKICGKTNNRRNYSEIYSNMALCYYYMGDYDASLNYHFKVLEIDRFFKDDKQIGDTYLNLASVYSAKKDYANAESLLSKSLLLFKKTDYKYGTRNAHESLSKIYEAKGEYQKALIASREYLRVASEISNEKNDRAIARLNIQYDTEKKEQKIRHLSQQSTIQKLQIEKRNAILAIVGGLVIISSIFVYMIFNRRKLLEKARLLEEISKQQELSAKAVFDAEEDERRRIAAELHDGVGQVLSCALMNLNGLFKTLPMKIDQAALAERSLALVTESYDEMRAISHQMMPNALSKKGLTHALKELVSKMDGKGLSVNLDISGLITLPGPLTETALYRVIQEALNNVIKHARATKVYISLISDAEGISVTIEDDGCGFDVSELDGKKGIGLKNIQSRIEFLKGTVEFESKPGKGTLLVINLPCDTKKQIKLPKALPILSELNQN
jgi:two-component system, NarL family, sensor kinase